MRVPSWTAQERTKALEAFSTGGLPAAAVLFPSLSERAVYERIKIARRWKWDKKPWTTHEVTRLKLLWRTGDSVALIAAALERSPSSVQQKAREQRLPARFKKPYTPGQLRIITEQADQLVLTLSSRLGHSPASIQNKIVSALMKRSKRQRVKHLEVS